MRTTTATEVKYIEQKLFNDGHFYYRNIFGFNSFIQTTATVVCMILWICGRGSVHW